MNEQTSQSSSPELSVLEKIARSKGEPSLFPTEVVRLHGEGRGIRARKELLRHAKSERNERLAEMQRAQADNLHLWQEAVHRAPRMYTLNGIGTRLIGRYQETAEGAYISTLWFTFVFAPLWPIASYVVLPSPEGGGWHFLAKTPLPPRGGRMRRVTGSAVAVLALLALGSSYWSGSHVDVFAFNGFDRSIVVGVGEEQQVVLARQHAVFPGVPSGMAHFSASWDTGSEPFESLDEDLSGHARQLVAYNVAGRAVLEVEYVTYGEAEPSVGHLLGAGPVLFLDAVDHPFSEPPDSVSVADGSTVERSVLYAMDDFVPAVNAVSALVGMGREGQAYTVALAELTAHPEDAVLALYAALTFLSDDLQGQLGLFRRSLDRAPEAVDLHRYYQGLWPEDDAETVRAEYADLLAANPGSAMYHYLAGRLEDDESAEALQHYQAALAIESDYPPTVRALGFRAVVLRDWTEALAQYDRYASFGPSEALEVYEERVRLRQRLRRPAREIDAVLEETLESNDGALAVEMSRAHLQAEAEPENLEEIFTQFMAKAARVFGPDLGGALRNNVDADLRITVGDLDGARAALDLIVDPEEIDGRVVMRLALSDGSTDEDRARLADLPGWPLGFNRPMDLLVVVGWVDAEERELALSQIGPDMEEIVTFLDGDLSDTAGMAEFVSEHALAVRVAVYFAAAERLSEAAGGAEARARRSYLAEALAMALPGELPYLER